MYELEAVLGREDVLRSVTAGIAQARVVALRQGFALVPVTPEFADAVGDMSGALERWSREGPVAYVEADIFGGTGTQSATVWENGRRVFGPLEEELAETVEGTPISQALRRMGAETDPPVRRYRLDEFDSVGLGRERRTEDWV